MHLSSCTYSRGAPFRVTRFGTFPVGIDLFGLAEVAGILQASEKTRISLGKGTMLQTAV